MTDYSKLSDFEINKCVAVALGHSIDEEKYGKASVGAFHSDGIVYKSYDYCNNPADAWPIIFSNRIGIAPGTASDKWAAYYCDWYSPTSDTNPLRAAMIVYLMMRDASHG